MIHCTDCGEEIGTRGGHDCPEAVSASEWRTEYPQPAEVRPTRRTIRNLQRREIR